MQGRLRIWRHFDVWLLGAVILVSLAGVAMIRSAIAGSPSLLEMPTRQAIYAAVGVVVAILTAAIDYRIWSALARPIYIFTVVVLGLVGLSGFVGFGSARWFRVGTTLIQPSELAKVLMILVLANFLARHKEEIHQPKIILQSLLLLALPGYFIFIQPDLSTAITLAVIWFAQVWAAGIQIKHLAALAGAGLLVPIAAWPFLKLYQKARVITFLFPESQPHYGATYNVLQALISIGSGGLFGQGYAQGTQVQLRFLKVRHTDFIFSAMAEEFGFLGAFLLILLLMFIIYRCLRAARMARDTFGSLICYGVAIMLLFQGAFNIGMNMNLFPVSGLPLPFFSYGGSSLLTSLLSIGLVESVLLRHKALEL
jgi:rod shape determining protein RodA